MIFIFFLCLSAFSAQDELRTSTGGGEVTRVTRLAEGGYGCFVPLSESDDDDDVAAEVIDRPEAGLKGQEKGGELDAKVIEQPETGNGQEKGDQGEVSDDLQYVLSGMGNFVSQLSGRTLRPQPALSASFEPSASARAFVGFVKDLGGVVKEMDKNVQAERIRDSFTSAVRGANMPQKRFSDLVDFEAGCRGNVPTGNPRYTRKAWSGVPRDETESEFSETSVGGTQEEPSDDKSDAFHETEAQKKARIDAEREAARAAQVFEALSTTCRQQ